MKASVQTKFFVPILGLILAGMAALVSLNSLTVSRAFDQALGESMNLLGQSLAHDIGGDIVSNLAVMRVFAEEPALARTLAGGDPAEANAVLTTLVRSLQGVGYANVFNLQGTSVASTNTGSVGKVSVPDRDYYRAVVQEGRSDVLSKALIARTTGKASVVLAQPVYGPDRKLIGLLNAGMDLVALTGTLSESRIGSSGYAFILDRDGMVLAHPDQNLLMKNDLAGTAFGRDILAVAGQGLVRFRDAQGGQQAAVRVDPASGWRFVVVAPSQDMRAHLWTATRMNLLVAGCFTVAVIAVIAFMVRAVIIKPLAACGGFAARVAEGRLDERLELKRTVRDEISDLARAMGDMTARIKANLEEAGRRGREAEEQTRKAEAALARAEEASQAARRARQEGMVNAADRLQDIVDALSSDSRLLDREVVDITKGVEEQEQRTAETATAMEEMNSTVMEVAKNAAAAAEVADKARLKAQDGQGVVGQALQAISRVDALSRELKTGMDHLGEQAQSIGRIMNVITDIADQTNLLALNAAIEAARAGDAGRGFAVVADEVRKLAEKTMSATKEVGEAIARIQDGTRQNVDKVDASAAAVVEATRLAGSSEEALKEIVGLVETTSSQVAGIATAAEQQSAASEQINRSEEEVKGITGRIAEGMRESSKAVSGLAGRIGELEQMVQTFRHDEG